MERSTWWMEDPNKNHKMLRWVANQHIIKELKKTPYHIQDIRDPNLLRMLENKGTGFQI